jgi:predicted DNA-binding transcriptional regulator AlpA
MSNNLNIPAVAADELPQSGDLVFGSLLVTARQASAACGKSLRTWRTWDSAGWIPRPVRIGRSTLWRADELREWVKAGCPRRAEWETRSC